MAVVLIAPSIKIQSSFLPKVPYDPYNVSSVKVMITRGALKQCASFSPRKVCVSSFPHNMRKREVCLFPDEGMSTAGRYQPVGKICKHGCAWLDSRPCAVTSTLCHGAVKFLDAVNSMARDYCFLALELSMNVVSRF